MVVTACEAYYPAFIRILPVPLVLDLGIKFVALDEDCSLKLEEPRAPAWECWAVVA